MSMYSINQFFEDIYYIDDFCSQSNNSYAMSKDGWKNILYSMFDTITNNTYLGRIPKEIIEIIFEMVRQLDRDSELRFYKNYISRSETHGIVLRTLRASKKDCENAICDKRIKIHSRETLLGTISERYIYKQNTGRMCHNTLVQILMKGVDTVSGLELFYKMIKDWMVWICFHSYIPEWERLSILIMEKIYEFNNGIYDIYIGKVKKDGFKTRKDIERANEITTDAVYFIENYLPYNLLTHGELFYEVYHRDEIVLKYYDNPLAKILYNIYTVTNVDPDSINIDEAYEFEMELYAPDYHRDVFKKYMRLRNGKIIIPKGKIPCFYWHNEKYRKAFI